MFVFGGDVDQLARQRNVADQQNINLAQSDQEARQRAIDIGQQRQDQANQRATAEQDQAFAFAAQQAQQQQASQDNDFRFNLGRQDEASARAEDTRRFNVGAVLQEKQLESTRSQNDYAEAVNAIESGDITSLADMTKSFPSLTPQQQQRAAMYLSMKSTKQKQDYQSVASAADAATGLVAPQPTTTTTKAHFWSTPVTTTVPAKKLDEDQAFAALAGNPKAKPLGRTLFALTWDENTQRFVPAIPKPEGWQPSSGVGTAAPPPQPTAPGNPAPAPFAFNNTATPTSPTVTTRPQLLSGSGRQWVPAGTVYKGHVSKGGYGDDPNTWSEIPQVQ